MTQLQGIRNFTLNLQPTMEKIRQARDSRTGKPAKLMLEEQLSILEYWLEICDYFSNERSSE